LKLKEIGNIVESLQFNCWCGEPIKAEHVHSYNHQGGIEVEGFEKKQWVYFVCPGCGYSWALWKILKAKGWLVEQGGEVKAIQEARP